MNLSAIRSLFLLFVALAALAACAASPAGPAEGDQPAPAAAPAKAVDDAAEPDQAPSPATEPVTGIELPIVTRHAGVFNGKRVDYTATVGAIDVADADGNPGARIVSIAYVADIEPGAPARPVVFFWNGGPISPSVYLHMGAFGPKRVAFPDDLTADPAAAPLVDNPYSILDVADMVYFDPAGTGFSRTLPGKPLKDYFSVAADGQQTAAFIAAWLKENGRLDSPAYIFGESYGTNRAAETAGQLARLPEPVLLDGVVLFGQAVNIIEYAQRPQNIISYAVSLPTLAAIGWYHGKAETGGADLEAFIAQAWDYARSEYLDALFAGNTLPPARLNQVAERLEQFSGLPAEVFVEQKLRVSKEYYRAQLFRDEGLIMGRADARYLGPAEPEGGEEAAGDTGRPKLPPDPANVVPVALADAFRAYLVFELHAPSADQYLIASPVAGLNDWAWGGQSPFARFDYGDAIDALFEKHPDARVLVGAGYYDTMTTIGASQYLIDQESWPPDRVQLKLYRGGHMAYSIDDSVREMADDLRALVGAVP